MNYENIKTPCYLFDIKVLKNRIDYLKSKLDFSLVYAIKANTFIAKEIEPFVERFEICSFGEFEICNNLNIDHKKMVISGVYKGEDYIEEMILKYDDILKYTIESINQYNLLKKLAIKHQKRIHVLIRLTSGNQFGITKEEAEDIIKDKNEFIIIDGIEYFSGTQKRSLGLMEKEINKINTFIETVKEKYDFEVLEVEYGPGLPVYYYVDDEFDEDTFLTSLNKLIKNIKAKTVTLELGRSIAASCGSYITKVVDKKTNKNGNFLIVDGGINHLVYYGQTLGMHIPHYEVYPKKESHEENYNVYGSLCTINDILVKSLVVRQMDIGDILVFKNVGAYSMTEGISLFLSRDLPQIMIKDLNGFVFVVREGMKTSNINFPNYKRSEENGKIN